MTLSITRLQPPRMGVDGDRMPLHLAHIELRQRQDRRRTTQRIRVVVACLLNLIQRGSFILEASLAALTHPRATTPLSFQ